MVATLNAEDVALIVAGIETSTLPLTKAAFVTANTTARRADTTTMDTLIGRLFKFDLLGITGEARRSLLNAIRPLLNKSVRTGTTISVKKENDVTEAFTIAVATSALIARAEVSRDPT